MKDKVSPKMNSNKDFVKNAELDDYEQLIIKLKNIKENIRLFRNNV